MTIGEPIDMTNDSLPGPQPFVYLNSTLYIARLVAISSGEYFSFLRNIL